MRAWGHCAPSLPRATKPAKHGAARLYSCTAALVLRGQLLPRAACNAPTLALQGAPESLKGGGGGGGGGGSADPAARAH